MVWEGEEEMAWGGDSMDREEVMVWGGGGGMGRGGGDGMGRR